MKSVKDSQLDRLCDKVVQYGFKAVASYSRGRASCVREFESSSRVVFVSCEEKRILVMDVLAVRADKSLIRVSINQLLWFNGIRAIAEADDCNTAASVAVQHFSLIEQFLNRDAQFQVDQRYCYSLNQTTAAEYMSFQRGFASESVSAIVRLVNSTPDV